VHFTNGGMGKCVLLKEAGILYSLIYAYESGQFVIASFLNKETGNWGGGSYFGKDLDDALECFNKRVEERKQDEQER